MKHHKLNLLGILKKLTVLAGLATTTLASATNFDLSLTKSADVTSAAAGSNVQFTIAVSNAGPYAATNIVIKDMLPKGFKFLSANITPSQTDAFSNTKIVQYYFNLGTIAAQSSKTIVIQTTAVAPSNIVAPSIDSQYDYKNIAEVNAVDYNQYDPDSRPNNCTYTSVAAGYSLEDDCGWVGVPVTDVVNPPPLPTTTITCNSMYALVAPDAANGNKIMALSDFNNLSAPTIALPSGVNSATLAVAPDGSAFYTAADSSQTLYKYTVSSGTWSTLGSFSGVNGRLVRMAMLPNGTGYTMDSGGNLWRFTSSGGITSIGQLSATTSNAPAFYANGDFVATADGKLYLLSALTGGAVSLWFVDPATKKAEYLGNLGSAGSGVQYNGLAAALSGIYAANSAGQLAKLDVTSVTMTPVGSATTPSTDLTSCYFPSFAPVVKATKTVTKVAGSAGTDVHPGDTLEYTITIRNSGTLPAGGLTFKDALPAGTTYVANSAKVNGFNTTNTNGATTYLSGSSYPFAQSVGFGSKGQAACDNQVLKVDTTPSIIDNEAVITFQVKVNDPFTETNLKISNQGVITYNDGVVPPTPILTDDPSTPEPSDSTIVPVVPYSKPQLTITKASNGPWLVEQTGALYTLNIKNVGNTLTTGTITVKDILPVGIEPLNTTFNAATDWSCTTTSNIITCTTASVLAVGASVSLTIPVKVTLNAIGNVINKASVGGGGDPDTIPDPSTCTTTADQCAINTTPVTLSNTSPTCSNLYGLFGVASSAINGTSIRLYDETNNTPGSLLAIIPNSGTSAVLSISTDGKRFFTATDSDKMLRIYDTQTQTWSTGSVFSGSTSRLVRMTVGPMGTGYAMDSDTNFWSFQTSGTYSTTYLGKINRTSSTGAVITASGDFFAAADGKLYMLTSNQDVIDAWVVNPTTLQAEYLGNLITTASGTGTSSSQFGGYAAVPSGLYGSNFEGRLIKVDLSTVTYSNVGSTTSPTTDLASCYYPTMAPKVVASKTVKKVAGSTGTTVFPGDTLEYTITVRNNGSMPAGGATFQDALPVGTSYVADSARINGFTTTLTNNTITNLAGTAYPFAQSVGICSRNGNACSSQVLKIDLTPNSSDNEAVIVFRVKINNPFTESVLKVSNQGIVTYNDGVIPPTPIFTDDPSTPEPNDPTVISISLPAKLMVNKTVQNISLNSPVGVSGTGNPSDVLEYCITTKNIGGIAATKIGFGDNIPTNTNFVSSAYGIGQDIKVTTVAGTTYYTADATDSDIGAVVNGRVTVNGGTAFSLTSGQSVVICFRASIK